MIAVDEETRVAVVVVQTLKVDLPLMSEHRLSMLQEEVSDLVDVAVVGSSFVVCL